MFNNLRLVPLYPYRLHLGADSEAVRFASRDAAMIVRMRGLPFDCNEQQIVSTELFSEKVSVRCTQATGF